MTSVFWYAPFDNAGEMALAEELARASDLDLTVESISERFGHPLEPRSHPDFTLVRDLPPPATERRGKDTVALRGWTAIERSARRGRLVRCRRFDLLHIHTYNPITDWAAIPLLRRRASIVVQSVHNVRPHDSIFPPTMETSLLRRGYRASSALVVAHDQLGHQLVTEFGVDPSLVHTIPFPITMPIRAPERAGQVEGGALTFLFFGTLRRNKGVMVMLEAIRHLNQRADVAGQIRFIIAGRGEPSLEAAVTAAERDLGNLTTEIGFVTDQRRQELYDQAHCVLLPYTSINAQSGVLHDAYSQHLPVIATDIGPIGTTVREHRSGWVIEPGSQSAIVDAILTARSSPQSLAAAGVRAGAVAENRTPDRIAARLRDLYDELLSSRIA
ncbi:MAG: glycosyltransferase family 4 protein [Candidatus Microthrix sp.]|nr:glycosyltransferase family 4 protein [Candidatus Microthrix sp.]